MKKLPLLIAFLVAMVLQVWATDVQVSATTITNLPFNPGYIGTDRSFTVSVTNGSAIVTSAGLFPAGTSGIVGIGGFKVSINGVVYDVASVASTSSLTLTTNYAATTGTATLVLYKYVLLRVYADRSFRPLGEIYVVQGGSASFFKQVACSIINDGANSVLYVPAFTLPATTDALITNQARYTFSFYRPDGSWIQNFKCGETYQFPLRPNSPTNLGDICDFAAPGVYVPPSRDAYSKFEIDDRLPSCLSGNLDYHAVTGQKHACLTVGSGLSISGGTITSTGLGGTVTSVGMTVPSILSVSGSPITTSGTLALSLANQSPNTVFAGPTGGGGATPTFRALVAADLPITSLNTQIIFNDAGNYAGDADFTWDKTGNALTIAGTVQATALGLGVAPSTATPFKVTQAASSSGSPSLFTITGGAHTTLDPDTEATDLDFNLQRNVQFTQGGGAFSLQRVARFRAPTYRATSAETISTVVTIDANTPVAGTNMTFTDAYVARFAPSAAAHGSILMDHPSSATGRYLDFLVNGSRVGQIKAAATTFNFANWVFGNDTLQTTDTDGFVYLPSIAGTPAGTPTSFGAPMIPTVIDRTNNLFYAYLSGAWTKLTAPPAGSGTELQYRVNATTFGAVAGSAVTTLGEVDLNNTARTSGGSTRYFRVRTPADTALTADTESIGIQLSGNASAATVTRQFTQAGGAFTTQREVVVVAPTYAFTSADTISSAASFAITNAPQPGANATLTNAYALWVQAGRAQFDGSINGMTLTNSTGTFTLANSKTFTVNNTITLSGTDSTTITLPATTSTVASVNSTTNVIPYKSAATAFSDSSLTVGTNLALSSDITARTSGAPTYFFRLITPADTSLTASTESVGVQFGGNSSAATVTRQWSSGALTTQREHLFVNPTYAFTGASTLTNAATVAIAGAPATGTNATITNSYALWIQGGKSLFADRLETTPTSTNAALRIGSLSGDPSGLGNGDFWYDSTAAKFRMRENGSSVNLASNIPILAAQFDKTNTTLSNITGLTHNVQAGKKYHFRFKGSTTLSSAGGEKWAISGTCTATAIEYTIVSTTTAAGIPIVAQATALDTAGSNGGYGAGVNSIVVIEGSITVNAGGTLTVQFAQAAASGTSSVRAGAIFYAREGL